MDTNLPPIERNSNMMWYVLHTYTSQEDTVKDMIMKGIKDTGLESLLGNILIPRQKTYSIRDGKKIEHEKKLFNSYILVECEMTTELHSFIVTLPNVTHFLGGKQPHSLPEHEVEKLLGIQERGKTSQRKAEYLPNDRIKINGGPFVDFEGTIDKISADGEKLIIKVTIFGRVTPVEVNIDQVEVIT